MRIERGRWAVLTLILLWPLQIDPGWAQESSGNAGNPEGEECVLCHSERAMFEATGDPDRYVVTERDLEGSVHGPLGLACSACHQGMTFPHPENAETSCSPCHAGVEAEFRESLHGYARSVGNERAPTCSSCHGSHQILSSSDPRSATHKVRLPSSCGGCHGISHLILEEEVHLPLSYQQYTRSVHGRAASRGLPVAASCTDCHGVHDLKGAADPASRINPVNVAGTCGQCHPDIQLQYERSIHWRALRAGVRDSPTCTDCHGEHLILSVSDPDSPTCQTRQSIETCGTCHNDPELTAKYGLQEGVVVSYMDSYHGLASAALCERTATCVDCHTAHQILPASDSASTVSERNVVATCGQCHAAADLNFARAYNHYAASPTQNPVNRIIREIYLWVIAIVIGGMALHNLLILNFHLIRKKRAQEHGGELVLRLNRSEVVQHLLLTLSFVTLAVTGFALRFPGAFWVGWLADLGMTEPVRRIVHRGAGLLLVATSVYHAWYILATRRGRRELKALLPTRQDLRDVVQNLAYHAFRSSRKPSFGRFDYTQKAEYWALVWGTVLMALTGFVLWFPEVVAKYLPPVLVPAAQTIHYYEAWLATLAILVWHFFFVIFHPDEYPMSWTWLTGKASKARVREHHRRWYDEEIEPGADPGLAEPQEEEEPVDVGAGG